MVLVATGLLFHKKQVYNSNHFIVFSQKTDTQRVEDGGSRTWVSLTWRIGVHHSVTPMWYCNFVLFLESLYECLFLDFKTYTGLRRCGKSCRLRWLNYLRPNIKHGEFSDDEDKIICTLFASIGSRYYIYPFSFS